MLRNVGNQRQLTRSAARLSAKGNTLQLRTPGARVFRARARARHVAVFAGTSTGALERFEAWCEERGVERPALALREVPGRGRGVALTAAADLGDVLLTVPRSAGLETTSKTLKCPVAGLVAEAEVWRGLAWDARLALLLLHEELLGPQSSRAPWLAVLPWRHELSAPPTGDGMKSEGMGSGIIPLLPCWSNAELDALGDPQLAADAEKERARWRSQLAAVRAAVAGGGVMEAEAVTEQRWAWAMANVRSRAFGGPYEGSDFEERARLAGFGCAMGLVSVLVNGDPPGALAGVVAVLMFIGIRDLSSQMMYGEKLRRWALCPAIDMLNHEPPKGPAAAGDEADVAYEYFADKFVVSSPRDFKAGDEALISYGDRSNAELLMRYGFVLSEEGPSEEGPPTRSQLATQYRKSKQGKGATGRVAV